MMNRPAYYELPISGSLTTKTGEVIEYRAESKRLEDGAYIIEGAWARDKDNIMFPWLVEFTGPFTFHFYPRPQTIWQRLRAWLRKLLPKFFKTLEQWSYYP